MADTYGDPTVSSTSTSNTLTDGQTATIAVKVTDPSIATERSSFDLTVNPGDIQVQVLWPVDE